MLFSRFTFTLIAVVAFPGVLAAHPGHGTGEGNTLLHYAISPLHMLPVFGVAAVVTLAWLHTSFRMRQDKVKLIR